MNRLILILLFFVLVTNNSTKAQSTGTVNFLVEVDNGYFEILVDDTTYLKIFKSELPTGKHSAKVWSPGYLTAAVEFEITEGQTTSVNVPMVISNERQKFEQDYSAYRNKFHKSLTLPLSISIGCFLGTTGVAIAGFNKRNEIQRDLISYKQTPISSEATFYSNRIELNNQKYKRLQIGYYSMIGLTAASIGTTLFTYSRFKKNNTEPKLNAESPFKDRFSWQVSPLGFNLSIKIG